MKEAISVLTPYKAQIDSIMTPVIGKECHGHERPTDRKSVINLVADVLRQAISNHIGKPADMAVN